MVQGSAIEPRFDRGIDRGPSPLLLIVPGLNDSGPEHWQSHWLDACPDTRRVDLGSWHDPLRNSWVGRLDMAVRTADRPVILVAHSLGCHAVAWWAAWERPDAGGPVIGAMLVAPPDVEAPGADPRLARFAPVVPCRLPFPSLLVASRNDPYITRPAARRLARVWGSRFVDAGALGHINAASAIGDWPHGRGLLDTLVAQVAPATAPSSPRPALSQRTLRHESQQHPRHDRRHPARPPEPPVPQP